MYPYYTCSIWRNSKNLFYKRILKKRDLSLKSKQEISFNDFIEQRRNQATRSVVVQVQSKNSFFDLYNYCSKFGDVIGAHHYKIKEENSNYILIEYESIDSINEVLHSANYNLGLTGIPAYSQLLWFKAASNSKTTGLSPVNSNEILKISDGLNKSSEADLLKLMLSADNTSDQIQILHETTKLNDVEIRLRFLAAKQIENSITGIFPNACALPFGSSVNGFGKMGCDLDLVLQFKREDIIKKNSSRLIFHTKENLTNERSQIQKQMESISDILQIFLPGVMNVRRILQARVPIIKFHHLILNLDVDLSMGNLSGVYMSELLYIFGEIDYRVRPLIFVIRKWAHSVGLTNPSPGRWITNFSLSCLVIFFLQQTKNPVLPSIHFLSKSATSNDVRVTDDGIDCTFLRNHNILNFKTKNFNNLYELLLLFFEFYSQFDFNNKAISLNKGSSVIKPDHSAIYIINPLEQNLNISKNISLEECERLRIEVRNAAWILENEVAKTNLSEETDKMPWGITNLFRKFQKTTLKPNIFFKPRMVEIKELFEEKIEDTKENYKTGNSEVENIKVLERNVNNRIKMKNENER